ncbi:hypothetical protein EPUL_005761 [Erysiphe pulchra]|uniref:DH domain-containing protein n=1 Tax=Erysiphe pulchra TaxID=225359 RepID=A0A2S4PVA8_9PEZI|nr:hypothetical protein EPUL_005761 [Erysiphe pulchra]
MEKDVNQNFNPPIFIKENPLLGQPLHFMSELNPSYPSKIPSFTSQKVFSTKIGRKDLPDSLNNGKNLQLGISKQANVINSQINTLGKAVTSPELRPTSSSVEKLKENGTTNYSPWTTRAHLKPSRSVSTSLENRSFANSMSSLALNNHSIAGKPSVKNLLRRFDSNYGDQTTSSTLKITDKKINSPRGKGQARIPTKEIQVEALSKDKVTSQSDHNPSGAARKTRVSNMVYSRSASIKQSITKTSPVSPTFLFGEVRQFDKKKSTETFNRARRRRRTSDPSVQPHDSESKISNSSLPISSCELVVQDMSRPKAHNRNHSDLADTKVNTFVSLGTRSTTPPHTSNLKIPLSSKSPISRSQLVSSSPVSNKLRENEQSQTQSEVSCKMTEDNTTKTKNSSTEQMDSPTLPAGLFYSPIESNILRKRSKGFDAIPGDLPILGVPGSYVEDDEICPNVVKKLEVKCSTETCASNPMHESTIKCPVPFEKSISSEQSHKEHTESIFRDIIIDKHVVKANGISAEPLSGYDFFGKDPCPPGAFQDEDTLLRRSLMLNMSSESHFHACEASEEPKNVESTLNDVDSNQSQHHIYDKYDVEIHDFKNSPGISDITKNQSLPNDYGDFQHPLTETYYEASENGLFDSENRSAISSQGIFSKHSSWQTDFSVGIEHEYTGRKQSIKDAVFPPSSYEERPTPPPKNSKLSLVVPQKPPGNSLIPSTSFQNTNISPQLPPVSTGEGFSLKFSQNYSLNTDTVPTQRQQFKYVPSSPKKFQRSTSSPVHRSSSSASSIPRPLSGVSTNISNSRTSSEDIYYRKESIPKPNTHNDLYDKKEANANLNAGISVAGQVETEEEMRLRDENRKRLYQRKMAIKELIDTEAVYFKDMNVVEEIYKGTAEACPNLEASDIKIIFRNTEEIVSFSNTFLEDLKLAALPIYSPRGPKVKTSGSDNSTSFSELDKISVETVLIDEIEEQRDKETFIGASFGKHLPNMQVIYTNFLKNSESASSRLVDLQKDPAVKVWLSECNIVAKDLTAAWDLDALLVKPVQRITRYQLLLKQIQNTTPETHPDSEALIACCQEISKLLKDIDDLKKRIHMVAKIVGRKRKESDVVRIGIAKAFGRRSDKANLNANRIKDDETYMKMSEKFGDDYLRLQVVLRDAEYYTRQVSIYVNDYLRFLSTIELIMRMSPAGYPEIESKWARFNVSMREIGTKFVEEHIFEVRKFVIEPFERMISAYNGPLLAMKKRDKRKIDFEKSLTLKAQGKKIDEKLQNLSNEYSALHETLKFELPKLSQLTEKMGKVILERLIYIQGKWFGIWVQRFQIVLEDNEVSRDISEIINQFISDFRFEESRLLELGIVNGGFWREPSLRGPQSGSHSRQISDIGNSSQLTRTESTNAKRSSTIYSGNRSQPCSCFQSPSNSINTSTVVEAHNRGVPTSPSENIGRRSFTSESGLRVSSDYNTYRRRESVSTHGSYHDGPLQSARPLSGIFHSSLPLENGNFSQSRASSRDRSRSRGYTVLYLAASLFEFNISATKKEAGYPYLTYQAGEIFDVIGEKGELWLAKNQDDISDTVGWIWSKHFARLAAN